MLHRWLLLFLVGVIAAHAQVEEYTNTTSLDGSESPSMAPTTEVYHSEAPSMAPSFDMYHSEAPSMAPTIVNETAKVVEYNTSDINSTLSPSAAPTVFSDSDVKNAQHTMLTRKSFIIGAFALTVIGGSFVVVYFYELCRPNKMLQTQFQTSAHSEGEWSSMKNEANRSNVDLESLEPTTDVTKLLANSDSVVFDTIGMDSSKYRSGHSRSDSKTGLLAENIKFATSKASSASTTPNHSRKNSVVNPMSLDNDLVVPNVGLKKR